MELLPAPTPTLLLPAYCLSSMKASRIDCICQHCGNLFKIKPSSLKYGEGKFCSMKCKKESYYSTYICENCGGSFRVKKSQINKGRKYCSKKCSYAASIKHVQCECLQCGKYFFIQEGQIKYGRGKYCSDECRFASRRVEYVECRCLLCSKIFSVVPSEIPLGRGKYCSVECRGIANRGKANSNWRGGKVGYYGSNWYSQRKLAYNRDGGRCQVCHRKPSKGENQFQVHHVVKRRHFSKDDPMANALDNLTTLCPQCHAKAERGKILVPVRMF